MILSDGAVTPASSSAVENQSIIEPSWWLTYALLDTCDPIDVINLCDATIIVIPIS